MVRLSLCAFCKHLGPKEGKRVCAAYPDGIPPEFLFGRRYHITPAEGDHGIQFEPAEGQERNAFVLRVLEGRGAEAPAEQEAPRG